MTSRETDLAVIEQKQVEFYGDDLVAVRVASGKVFVPLRPICDLLGVDWAGQRRRVNRDSVLAEEVRSVDVTSIEGNRTATRKMLCLPLDLISGFLFGVSADRVKPELKDRVIRYQKECYKVLSEAFQEGRLTAEPDFSDLLSSGSPAAQAYKIAAAIMQMARQQLLLETQLETQAAQLVDHEDRLEVIETTLGDPGRNITPDQASQISQAVKAVALELSQKSGRNEYGGVYGELYRKFGITSYKLLPSKEFKRAMEWLTEWYASLTDKTVPF